MTLSGMQILLAEDNPTNQMVAMQMLESLGADVALAVDGAEALEMLQQQHYDVALIDIEMPRISGIDLIRRLRSLDGDLAEMPLIALTAYVMREHRAAIDEAGADGIIAKPILSIEQFGDDIIGYVRLRKSARASAGPGHAAACDDDAPGIDFAIYDLGAQLLVTAEGVRRMRPGSVIVDLAAERGGNCELTRMDEIVMESGVTILGPTNLPSEVPQHASQMYAKNLATVLQELTKDGELDIDLNNEVLRDTLVAKDGQVQNARLRSMLGLEPLVKPPATPPTDHLADVGD